MSSTERNQRHVGFVGIPLAASFELEYSWTETDDVGHLQNDNVVFEVQLGSQIPLRQGRQAYGTRPIYDLSTCGQKILSPLEYSEAFGDYSASLRVSSEAPNSDFSHHLIRVHLVLS
jgi:hypothetical protein